MGFGDQKKYITSKNYIFILILFIIEFFGTSYSMPNTFKSSDDIESCALRIDIMPDCVLCYEIATKLDWNSFLSLTSTCKKYLKFRSDYPETVANVLINSFGNNSISHAIKSGVSDLRIYRSLMKKGISLSYFDYEAIDLAIYHDRESLLFFFLNEIGEAEALNKFEAMVQFLSLDRFDLVQLMLLKLKRVDFTSYEVTILAIRFNIIPIFDFMDEDEYEFSSGHLVEAAINARVKMAQLMLENPGSKIDSNALGEALTQATMRNHIMMVMTLMEYGAQFDYDNNLPIEIADSSGYMELSGLLRSYSDD